MMWDKSTTKMKEYEDLSVINSPINEFYWHEESYESQALNNASSHLNSFSMASGLCMVHSHFVK
jgi:hypothetical protein